MENNEYVDWFDALSEDQQKDILEGLAQADRGETVPHAEVVNYLASTVCCKEDQPLFIFAQ